MSLSRLSALLTGVTCSLMIAAAPVVHAQEAQAVDPKTLELGQLVGDTIQLMRKGDWAEEWFTIYPDGTHVRHMKNHTALAAMSQPFSRCDGLPPQ